MKVEISSDGKNYVEVAALELPPMEKDARNGIYEHVLSFPPMQARYVKITALSEKQIPDWHGGKGHPGFLFVDEITIE